jgi:hypothetical protein
MTLSDTPAPVGGSGEHVEVDEPAAVVHLSDALCTTVRICVTCTVCGSELSAQSALHSLASINYGLPQQLTQSQGESCARLMTCDMRCTDNEFAELVAASLSVCSTQHAAVKCVKCASTTATTRTHTRSLATLPNILVVDTNIRSLTDRQHWTTMFDVCFHSAMG